MHDCTGANLFQANFSFSNFGRRRLRLYDKLTLAVLVLLPILALLAGKWDATTLRFAIVHAFALVVILALIRAEAWLPKWAYVLREWYPIVLLTFFFGEVGRLVNLLFPFWLEPYLIQSDYVVFGSHAYEYFASRLDPVSTEIFAFAYWAYYPLIPFVAALFYFSRRRATEELQPTFEQVMNRICACLYLCYVCFILLPARGPHHALHVNITELTSGGFFFNFVLAIQQRGSVVGAAFPSSHVAAAWAVILPLRHGFKKTFWFLLPLVVLLSVSTFVLQYHYWIDALAGIVLACALERFISHREKRADKGGPQSRREKEPPLMRREIFTGAKKFLQAD